MAQNAQPHECRLGQSPSTYRTPSPLAVALQSEDCCFDVKCEDDWKAVRDFTNTTHRVPRVRVDKEYQRAGLVKLLNAHRTDCRYRNCKGETNTTPMAAQPVSVIDTADTESTALHSNQRCACVIC